MIQLINSNDNTYHHMFNSYNHNNGNRNNSNNDPRRDGLLLPRGVASLHRAGYYHYYYYYYAYYSLRSYYNY